MRLSNHLNGYFLACFFTVSLFLFLRWFNLGNTLLFYNDMGRDYLTLLNWQETGRPPLLGPQTSVLSYNQSAWFFYILFPLFWLTNSPFSNTATLSLVFVVIFSSLAWRYRHQLFLRRILVVVTLLLSIHPYAIWQQKFIWNPSFVPLFLLVAVMLTFELAVQFSAKRYFIFVLSLAAACGFSYSSLPVAGLLWLYLGWRQHTHLVKMVLLSGVAGIIIALPMLAFEIRHSFTLTKLAVVGQTNPQPNRNLKEKNFAFDSFVLSLSPTETPKGLGLVLRIILLGLFGWGTYTLAKESKFARTEKFPIAVLFLLLVTVNYLAPVSLEKHYIFPILILGFTTLALFPPKVSAPITILLLAVWLHPFNLRQLLVPAPRTIAEMQQCYQQLCATVPQPIYVSMESSILIGYHNGLEHQYLLRQAGCQVLDIELSQNQANHMVVINDGGRFTPGQSGYRELSLFGSYQTSPVQHCTAHLSWQLLTKATTEQVTSGNAFSPR